MLAAFVLEIYLLINYFEIFFLIVRENLYFCTPKLELQVKTYEGEGPLWKPHLTFGKQVVQCIALSAGEGQVQCI